MGIEGDQPVRRYRKGLRRMATPSVLKAGFDKSENLPSQLQRMKIPLTSGNAYFNTLTAHAIDIRNIQRAQVHKMDETIRALAVALAK